MEHDETRLSAALLQEAHRVLDRTKFRLTYNVLLCVYSSVVLATVEVLLACCPGDCLFAIRPWLHCYSGLLVIVMILAVYTELSYTLKQYTRLLPVSIVGYSYKALLSVLFLWTLTGTYWYFSDYVCDQTFEVGYNLMLALLIFHYFVFSVLVCAATCTYLTRLITQTQFPLDI